MSVAEFTLRYPNYATPRGRGKARKNIELIEAAREILAEIKPASVRAVCYQLFNHKLIGSMGKADTSRVSVQLTYAREQGIIPWSWIVDETREIDQAATWENPAALLEDSAGFYRRNWWKTQPVRIVVASEKSTVSGTVRPITQRFGVGFLSLHGYSSATAAHDLAELANGGQPLLVLYVGDWDCSSMDMSERDLPGRIRRYGGLSWSIERIALTAQDLAQPSAADFPAEDKRGDRRYAWFVERYGHRCRELDALNPNELRQRVESAIKKKIDVDAWRRCRQVEKLERESLMEVVAAWKGGRP